MSMAICDYCGSSIDTDSREGEWDVMDKDGEVHDFVCEDCLCGEDFLYDDATDKYIKEVI